MHKTPFFSRFVENQRPLDVQTDLRAGKRTTLKYPSDSEEVAETMKYPSDSDEGGISI